MTEVKDAPASAYAYEPKVLAKKFRISLDESTKILVQYGADRKAVDKAARRIAV